MGKLSIINIIYHSSATGEFLTQGISILKMVINKPRSCLDGFFLELEPALLPLLLPKDSKYANDKLLLRDRKGFEGWRVNFISFMRIKLNFDPRSELF